MASQYLSIPFGRDFQFSSNITNTLANISPSPNIANANWVFMAKAHPDWETNPQAAIVSYPTANVLTNIVTCIINSAQSSASTIYNSLWWEISVTLASGLFYTVDQGRAAITQPVRIYPPSMFTNPFIDIDPSDIDSTITTLAQLAGIATAGTTPPIIKIWVQASDATTQVWVLQTSVAPTSNGVQRPNDFNSTTNAKVWYKAS